MLVRSKPIYPPDQAKSTDFFWVSIQVTDGGGWRKEAEWRMLSIEVLQKWTWYFNYRAALAQVQHPRKQVQWATGYEEQAMIDPVAHELLMLSRKIRAARAKITEWTNKLDRAVANIQDRDSRELFSLDVAADPGYQRSVTTIEEKKQRLQELIQRRDELQKTAPTA